MTHEIEKHNKPEPAEVDGVSGYQDGDRRLLEVWDDSSAQYKFHLQILRKEWSPECWEEVASGDRQWSQLIAVHYDLKVQSAEVIES